MTEYNPNLPTGEIQHLNSNYPAINFNIINQVGTFSTTNIYGIEGVINTVTSNPKTSLKLKKSLTINSDNELNSTLNNDHNTSNLTSRSKKSSMANPKISGVGFIEEKSFKGTPKHSSVIDLKNKSVATKQITLGSFKEPSKLRKIIQSSNTKKEPDKSLVKSESTKKIKKINYVASRMSTAEAKRHLAYSKNNKENLDETRESMISECSMSESKNDIECQLSSRYSTILKPQDLSVIHDDTPNTTHKKNTSSLVSEDSLYKTSTILNNDNLTVNSKPIENNDTEKYKRMSKIIQDKVMKNELELNYSDPISHNCIAILMAQNLLEPSKRLKFILGCTFHPSPLIKTLKAQVISSYQDKLNELKSNYSTYLNESKAELMVDFKNSSTANQALMFIKDKSESELLEAAELMEPSSLILRFFSMFIILVFDIDPLKIVKIETEENKEYYHHKDYEFDATKDITTINFEDVEIHLDEKIGAINREQCPLNSVKLFYILLDKKYKTKSISK